MAKGAGKKAELMKSAKKNKNSPEYKIEKASEKPKMLPTVNKSKVSAHKPVKKAVAPKSPKKKGY